MTTYTPLTKNTLAKNRYDKPFEQLDGYLNWTFVTLPTGTGFLEGTVVDIDASGRVVPAASGLGMGFAIQTVEDMTAMNGRRNMQQTRVHLGDVIGVTYGIGAAATKVHEGSGDVGDYAWWDGDTLQFDALGEVPSGVKIIGRLLQADGTNPQVGVNGTAGSKSTPSDTKALILFDFTFKTEYVNG